MKKTPIAICGATATGKTGLSLMLAEKLPGEIVSSDSMQLYRGMDIGTAKPTKEEMKKIPHHMIDILDPDTSFSAAEYRNGAEKAIEDISSRGKTPIICGGTGLYLDAIVYENKYSDDGGNDEKNAAIRSELEKFYDENGADALWERLREVDPESADAIHKNNVRRVIRALQIFISTGKTKTEWDRISRTEKKKEITVIGLRFKDRELHRRVIAERCHLMLDGGLIEETERLYEAGSLREGTTAYQAIGYKEILPYIKGEISLEEAEKSLFYATCRYAKRQATWFYAKDYINWLEVDELLLGGETKAEFYERAVKLIDPAGNEGADISDG